MQAATALVERRSNDRSKQIALRENLKSITGFRWLHVTSITIIYESGVGFAASPLGKPTPQARRPNPLEPCRGSGVCGLTNGPGGIVNPKKNRGIRRKGIGREKGAAAPRPRAAILAPPLHILVPLSSRTCAAAPLYLPISHEPWLRRQFARRHRWSLADLFLPLVALPYHNPLRKINK
jgi:hypothetical protein